MWPTPAAVNMTTEHSRDQQEGCAGCSLSDGSPVSSNREHPGSPVPTVLELEGLLSAAGNSGRNIHASPAGSSTTSVVCRICHGDAADEDLIALCHCAGSMGLVHQSCVERWLEFSNNTHCEICNYAFNTQRKPKSFSKWFLSSDTTNDRRNLLTDLACFLVLTPVAIVSMWLCVTGATHYSHVPDTQWEVAGLLSLAAVLIIIHIGWCVVAMRYHVRIFRQWRSVNQEVKLVENSNLRQPRQYSAQDADDSSSTVPRCTHSGPCGQQARRRGFSECSIQSGSSFQPQNQATGRSTSDPAQSANSHNSCRRRGYSESSASTCNSCKSLIYHQLSDGSLCSTCRLPCLGTLSGGVQLPLLPLANSCCRRSCGSSIHPATSDLPSPRRDHCVHVGSSATCGERQETDSSARTSCPGASCSCTVVSFANQSGAPPGGWSHSEKFSGANVREAAV